MKFILLFFTLSLSNLSLSQSCFEKYPFNETVSIKIISYSNMDSTLQQWKWQSCITMPILKDALNIFDVDFSKLDVVKTINLKQAGKLYEIANKEDGNCLDAVSPKDCSNVKRGYGILFLDEQNRIFAIVDFCFECNLWTRSEGGLFEPLCDEKMQQLRQFFTECGVE